jgi:hypothetical protein
MADGQNISLEDEIEDFKEKCREWFPVEITDANASRFRDLIALGVDLNKRIEARRKAEKQPHMDAGKAVDDTHKALAEPVTKGADFLKGRLTKFMLAEEAKRRAAAEEAERIAALARKAAEAEAQPDEFTEFVVQTTEAQAAEAAANAKAKVNIASAEGIARSAGLRTFYEVDVTDGPALVAHFASSPHIIEECRKLAAAQVRAAKGACGIPGINVREEKRVA